MNDQELRIGPIFAAANSWAAEQDELARAIHALALASHHERGHAPTHILLHRFPSEYPRLWGMFRPTYIEKRIAALMSSEFTELSFVLSDLFLEFNDRYFGSALGKHRVAVMHNIPPREHEEIFEPPLNPSPRCASDIDVKRKRLRMVYNGWPARMVETLLILMGHAMAHGRTSLDGGTAYSELERLIRAGAPISDQVLRPVSAHEPHG